MEDEIAQQQGDLVGNALSGSERQQPPTHICQQQCLPGYQQGYDGLQRSVLQAQLEGGKVGLPKAMCKDWAAEGLLRHPILASSAPPSAISRLTTTRKQGTSCLGTMLVCKSRTTYSLLTLTISFTAWAWNSSCITGGGGWGVQEELVNWGRNTQPAPLTPTSDSGRKGRGTRDLRGGWGPHSVSQTSFATPQVFYVNRRDFFRLDGFSLWKNKCTLHTS